MMASQRATTTSARRRQRAILIATVVGAASLDGVTKLAAEATLDDGPEHIVGPLALKLGHNAGVAFGLGATGPAWMVLAVTAVVIAVLARLQTLPEALYEAARIDGATHWQVLRHVALPLSAPALGALAALTFIGTWNMYLWPLVVTKSREMQTAQIAVNFILNEEVARWNVVAAGAILVLLPTLIAFLLAQRAFVRGIALGGLKG